MHTQKRAQTPWARIRTACPKVHACRHTHADTSAVPHCARTVAIMQASFLPGQAYARYKQPPAKGGYHRGSGSGSTLSGAVNDFSSRPHSRYKEVQSSSWTASSSSSTQDCLDVLTSTPRITALDISTLSLKDDHEPHVLAQLLPELASKICLRTLTLPVVMQQQPALYLCRHLV